MKHRTPIPSNHRPGLRIVSLGLILLVLGACSPEAPGVAQDASGAAHDEGFVELDSAAAAQVKLEVVAVQPITDDALEATGTIIYNLNRVARVGPRAEGRVVRIRHDLGDRVSRGTPLAVLESPELGEAEAAHAQARAEVALARENYERERSLFEKGISSRKEMLEAKTELERRAAEFAAATARHRTLGAVEHDTDTATRGGIYTVSAPLSGTVVERDLVLGEIVGPGNDLFTVADLTTLWLILDIYDRDLSRVRVGLPVEVATSAFPGERFTGRLTYLGQVVDSVTRTVKARVVIDNPDQKLRPGMFATAAVRGITPSAALGVPQAAIQQLDGRTVVFVPTGPEPWGRFEIRDVEVGPELGTGLVPVISGLMSGARVASRGSFYLKSELLKESFGGEH